MYALEVLPLELLLSPCKRIKVPSASIDSWIPTEVIPLQFEGKHNLRLNQTGFVFESTKEDDHDVADFQFFVLPRSCYRLRHCLLSFRRENNEEDSLYWVETRQVGSKPSGTQSGCPSNLLIILLVHGINPKAARFKVSRVLGKTTYLHFDCPLRISYVKGSKTPGHKHLLWPIHHLTQPLARENFVLERSSTSSTLGTARPQNTVQHEGRLNITHEWT